VIWANHLMRASVTAMRETAQVIHTDQGLCQVEGRIAPIKDIFELVDNAELEAAERRYLPERRTTKAVILAASAGDLGALTDDRPKCMVDVRGSSVLQRLVTTLGDCGVREITVVRGYRKEAIALRGIKTVDNDRFAETGEVHSLLQAATELTGELVIAYGDVLFRNFILESLLSSQADVVLAVDALNWGPSKPCGRDLVRADRDFSGDYLDTCPVHLRAIEQTLEPASAQGEWMGVVRFSARGVQWLREALEALEAEGLGELVDMPFLLTWIAARHPVRVKYFTGHWMDVDTLSDVADARNFT
jgi:phosphoenolpyruvate phosphomutase